MKYIDEYSNTTLVRKLTEQIFSISKKKINLMEVCGGHTMAIQKFGIPSLLPPTINLLSGPGCPVCVTGKRYIDRAIAYCRLPECIVTTYGDLIRVPGTSSSLEHEKARGADVRIVYSTFDALAIAAKNKDKKVLFLGIGFETTTPASAIAILEAKKQKIHNFFLYSAHKLMPPVMSVLIDEGIKIDGYIGPGHVSAVAGSKMYSEIAARYNLAIVVSGFEPLDLLQTILMLVKQIEYNKRKVEIQYKRVVTFEGNTKAQEFVSRVFQPRDDWWRGLGILKNSGLKLQDDYSNYDAEKQIDVEVEKTSEPKGCICGEVLKGLKKSEECRLFRKICTPVNPVGACMVSNEGACSVYFRYS